MKRIHWIITETMEAEVTKFKLSTLKKAPENTRRCRMLADTIFPLSSDNNAYVFTKKLNAQLQVEKKPFPAVEFSITVANL